MKDIRKPSRGSKRIGVPLTSMDVQAFLELLQCALREELIESLASLTAAAPRRDDPSDAHTGPAGEGEFITTMQVAKLLGRGGEEASIERELRRSKMVNSRGRGANRRWERDSVQRWIQDTTERPGAAKDYFNPDY
jgi:hypothetical protein